MNRAERNLDTLRSCFAAIATGDAEAVTSHYSEDYVLELPYPYDPTQPAGVVLEGRESVRDYLSQAFQAFRFELEIETVHPAADADLLVLEYPGEGTALVSGKAYANRYMGFWWFRAEQICRTREYYDPSAAAAALA